MKIKLKKNIIFKQTNFVEKIYILFFILIMFSGNTFIRDYVSIFMLIESLLLFLMSLCIKKSKFKSHLNLRYLGPFIILLIFTIFIGFQVNFSYTPDITKVYFGRFIIYSVYLLFCVHMNINYLIIKICKLYSIIVAISIIIISILTGSKAGGLVGDYQAAGMMMSISVILFLIDYYYKKSSYYNIIGILLSLVGVLISGKRMFAIIAGISFFILYYISGFRKNLKKFMKILIWIIPCIVVGILTIEQIQEVIRRFIELDTNVQTMTSGRNVLWSVAWSIFIENKGVGIGFGSFKTYFENNYSFPGIRAFTPHNIYFGLLAETGIVGFGLFMIFSGFCFLQTWKKFKSSKKLNSKICIYVSSYSLALQGWFIIYGFTGNGIYDANEMFFYIMAISMMFSVGYELRRLKKV